MTLITQKIQYVMFIWYDKHTLYFMKAILDFFSKKAVLCSNTVFLEFFLVD